VGHRVLKRHELYGIAIPSRGGDTRSASMYDGPYAALPRRALKSASGNEGRATPMAVASATGPSNCGAPRTAPAAGVAYRRAHHEEETGRKSLYGQSEPTSCAYPRGSATRSERLIDELTGNMSHHAAPYRHKWQAGDS